MPISNDTVKQGAAGAAGAGAGFLQAGIPGAAVGFLSGLFGGGAQSTQDYEYEELGGERQGMVNSVMKQLGPIMEQLSPEKRAEMIGNLETKFGKAFTDEIRQNFDTARGKVEANFARTGTGPASVINSQRGELTKQEGVQINKGLADASIMANNIGSQAYGQFAGTATSLMNTGVQIFNSRKQTKGTTTGGPSDGQNIAGMFGDAVSDYSSHYNTNGVMGMGGQYTGGYDGAGNPIKKAP